MDWRLGRELKGDDVTTVYRQGWAGINNGELLSLAEKEFDVLLTVDQNLPFQQSVSEFDIAVVVLKSSSTRLVDLRTLLPVLLPRLRAVKARQINWIGI